MAHTVAFVPTDRAPAPLAPPLFRLQKSYQNVRNQFRSGMLSRSQAGEQISALVAVDEAHMCWTVALDGSWCCAVPGAPPKPANPATFAYTTPPAPPEVSTEVAPVSGPATFDTTVSSGGFFRTNFRRAWVQWLFAPLVALVALLVAFATPTYVAPHAVLALLPTLVAVGLLLWWKAASRPTYVMASLVTLAVALCSTLGLAVFELAVSWAVR